MPLLDSGTKPMRRVAAAAILFVALGVAAAAQSLPLAEDRAAIDACLQQEKDAPERCIGIVYKPCTDAPEGSSTAGMGDCASREKAVWDEKVDASFKQLLAGTLGQTAAEPWNRPPENKRDTKVPGTDILNDMQRTWRSWRAKKCDALSMQAEGGSLSRVLYGSCIYEETARHALWLAALVEDTQPH
jgi:uncharacterized protein YecT (DUF1311 family)